MPIVSFKLTNENMSVEQKKALIAGATDLLVQVLNKPRATIDVIIEEIHTDNWGVGGQSITEIKQQQAQVTANRKDECVK